MLDKILFYIKKFDWILFFAVILLACLGLAEIYSISLGQESLSLLNFKKQIIFILVGVFLLFFFAFLDYHFLTNSSNYIYIFGVLLLVSVLIFGSEIRGTKGWFYIAGLGIQPAEFMKIILITFLAKFFSLKTIRSQSLRQLVLSGAFSFVLISLILLQPDFGSALILIAIWLMMLFFAGFNKKYFIIISLILAISFGGAWFFAFKDYQKQRILTFLNPNLDSLSEGYNVAQATIAVGAGRIMGRGLGFGSQSQLRFLPEAQNDFIFAVIAEELGFLGVSLIFFFFAILYYRCLSSIRKINNDFGIFFILGAMGLIFLEMFINIGMNTGLLPVVGISLPFISYGGSSIISKFILIGIVESIIIRSKTAN